MPDKKNERELFERALEFSDTQERTRFLDQACGSDQGLRADLEALLEMHEATGEFLLNHEPKPDSDSTGVSGFQVGDEIGPYRLLEQIGRGGMGVVFVAEQRSPVRRKVALKLIRPGMDSDEVLKRFDAERQALALMEHPHIARVLDAGQTTTGRPYFVMELVRGIPLTQFCDEHRLSTDERLRLFADVCHAVQHAHQKGIIHRDLKPSNILVTVKDSKPIVKIIDFGVSKAIHQKLTDETVYTKLTQMIGTPLYMSPEQAEMSQLDVDTRTDIYSLGVVLYELLTGDTPFERQRFKQAAFDEMRRIIRDEDPPKPSSRLSSLDESISSMSEVRSCQPRQLLNFVKGDLDWIVMKAIEKDRTRRYESAGAFAEDIHRFLVHEPVSAGPPRASYRMKKFVRRNRATVLFLATLACALILGVTGTIVGWAVALEQRDVARNAEKEMRASATAARKAQASAEQQAAYAQEAVNRFLTALGDDRLRDIPQVDSLRQELLLDALDFNQRFLQSQASDKVRLEAIRALRRMGRICVLLGELEQARGYYAQARVWLDEPLLDEQFQADSEVLTAQVLFDTAEVLTLEDNDETAESLLREALQRMKTVPAVETRSESLDLLGGTELLLGEIAFRRGDTGLALDAFDRGVMLWESPALTGRTTVRSQLLLAQVLRARGRAFRETQKPDRAEADFERSAEIFDRFDAETKKRRDVRESLVESQNALANFYMYFRRHNEALDSFLLSTQSQRILVQDFPETPDYKGLLAESLSLLAICHARLGKMALADGCFVESRDLYGQLHERFPGNKDYAYDFAHSIRKLGVHDRNLGRGDFGEARFLDAYERFETLLTDTPDSASYMQSCAITANLLAVALRHQDQNDPEVATWNGKAIRVGERLVREYPERGVNRHKLGQYYAFQAGVLEDRDEFSKAEAFHLKAIESHERLAKDDPTDPEFHRYLAIHLWRYAECLAGQDRHQESTATFERCIRIGEQTREMAPAREDHHVETGMFRNAYGACLVEMGEFSNAMEQHRQAVDIYAELLESKPDSARLSGERAYSLRRLGESLQGAGQDGEARDVFDQARSAFERQLELDPESAQGNDRWSDLLSFMVLDALKHSDRSRASALIQDMENSPNNKISNQLYVALAWVKGQQESATSTDESQFVDWDGAEALQKANDAFDEAVRLGLASDSWNHFPHKEDLEELENCRMWLADE